ncbi:MAG: DUF4298 domain-containing protein [Mogibacterium sp.]|nr:DUF4298 domain-containing protein [Mogibacterium sp.]
MSSEFNGEYGNHLGDWEAMDQVERIKAMEKILDASRLAVDDLAEAVLAYEAIQKAYFDLVNYYSSTTWMADFEDDEQGKLPEDLKRGVLTEDAVYDLITDHKYLLNRMQQLILNSMQNDL